MALMLLLGTSSAWAANEYGMQYLYVDCKSFTSYTQVNADMYWGVNCSDKAEYKSAFPKCSNDNNVFYVDLKSLNSSSYTYYRAFEISQGSGWNYKKCFSVPASNKNNSIKISGWGAGSWSNFALTPSSVTLKVTSGATGGAGTQNDPYLVEVGSQFTLSASSLTFNPADPVMVGRYSFGTSTNTTPTGTSTTSNQTASSTANTTTRYYVSVRGYYNGVYSSSYKTASVYVKTVASCTDATLSWASTFDGSMKVGDEVTNPASLDNAAAASSISYTSSNPDVISVNGTTLTALKSGKATITASATKNTGYCDIESITKEVTVTCDVVNTEDIRIEVVYTGSTSPSIWAWEPNNGNKNLTGGIWPGTTMNSEGNNLYSWEAKPTSGQSVSIIISGGNKQTVDIDGLQIGKRYKFKYDPTNGEYDGQKLKKDLLEEDCLDPACPTPEQPELSEGKAILDNCGNIAAGIIKIDNYENYGTGYTFKLDGTLVPADDGTISVSTAKEYTVTVTNECGSEKNNKVTISEDIITEPNNSFTVSASIPQIKFDENDGSININLSGSESGVTYNLYNGDVIVENTTKIGTGNSLEWTGIVTPGIYKVKANNPCDGGTIQMSGSFDYQCISDLKIEFEGGNNTFCPNGSANIIISLKGTDFTKYTNAGNYGWKWVYTTGGLSYALSTKPANEAKHVVTIKKAGTVKLQIRTCGGILESNELSYNIVTAPEKPLLDSYAKEICTGETAEITISPYDNAYTYKLYKGVNEVETPEFNAGVFTVSEAGSYTIKAVEQECNIESTPSDPFNLTVNGTTITQSPEVVHPYEVVTFTAGEQAKWALYTNPSSGSQLSDDDAKYSGKDTAYITKGESRTTTFKGEVANGYVIHATVGDCTASYTFNVVEDPNNCQ